MIARTLAGEICEALDLLEAEGYQVTEGRGSDMNLARGGKSILRNCGSLRVAFTGLLRVAKQYRAEAEAFSPRGAVGTAVRGPGRPAGAERLRQGTSAPGERKSA
jgi:hypothetical protein